MNKDKLKACMEALDKAAAAWWDAVGGIEAEIGVDAGHFSNNEITTDLQMLKIVEAAIAEVA